VFAGRSYAFARQVVLTEATARRPPCSDHELRSERRSCARQLSYKRQRADLRPSLFWNAYVGWSPTAPASRLIIPGVLSLRANRLLDRQVLEMGAWT